MSYLTERQSLLSAINKDQDVQETLKTIYDLENYRLLIVLSLIGKNCLNNEYEIKVLDSKESTTIKKIRVSFDQLLTLFDNGQLNIYLLNLVANLKIPK